MPLTSEERQERQDARGLIWREAKHLLEDAEVAAFLELNAEEKFVEDDLGVKQRFLDWTGRNRTAKVQAFKELLRNKVRQPFRNFNPNSARNFENFEDRLSALEEGVRIASVPVEKKPWLPSDSPQRTGQFNRTYPGRPSPPPNARRPADRGPPQRATPNTADDTDTTPGNRPGVNNQGRRSL